MSLAPIVVEIVRALSCAAPVMPFHDFYASYYYSAPPGTYWAGRRTETLDTVEARVESAILTYDKYIKGRAEKCRTIER